MLNFKNKLRILLKRRHTPHTRLYIKRACCKRTTIFTMVFKLPQATEKKWQRLHGYELIKDVLKGVKFIDGVKYAT